MKHPIIQYFSIEEVVCPHIYKKFNTYAWNFFDPRLLDTVYFIRNKTGIPMVVNDWYNGGSLSQRGLRCNVCMLVREKTDLQKVYITPHYQGTGWDFNVKGQSAEDTRIWIEQHKLELPHPIRLESDVSWVHLDVRTNKENGLITYFNG